MPNLAMQDRTCLYGYLVGIDLTQDQNPQQFRRLLKQFLVEHTAGDFDVELLGPIQVYDAQVKRKS